MYRIKPFTRQIKTGSQTGVTMIEAMVALFVFSVGALGLAAMQTASLVHSDDSRQRSLAIWKAQELAERIRSTKTAGRPAGLAAAYVAGIANNNLATSGIGDDNVNKNGYQCPNNAPTRCADYRSNLGVLVAGANCTDPELVAFDIWDVFCEGNTGLATDEGDAAGANGAGSRGLLDMEVALVPDVQNIADLIAGGGATIPVAEFYLYVEWVARSADKNEELTGDVNTVLCGDDVDVDAKLNVYCLRFK